MFDKVLNVKNYHLSLLFLCIFLIGKSTFSQKSETISCLTEMPHDFLERENKKKDTFQYYLNEYYNKLQSKTSTAITNVPAKIHIVTDANGATSITLDEILDEIDEANSFLTSFLKLFFENFFETFFENFFKTIFFENILEGNLFFIILGEPDRAVRGTRGAGARQPNASLKRTDLGWEPNF